MDERPTKRRGPIGWLAGRFRRHRIGVSISILPLYFLGFGWLMWLDARGYVPTWTYMPLQVLYSPVVLLADNGPESVRDALNRYVEFSRQK